MQGEDGAADGADTGNAGSVPEETEYDEHIWLSPLNAQILVTGIADAMAAADPANASAYKDNAAAYNTKLADLDGRYREAADNAKRDTVIFGDRFPFRYLIDECGLNYYAAFSGCSAETEASFETVVFLSGKIDELDIRTILVIEDSDQKVAQTLISNTASKDQEILVMDSMQSTTSSDSAKGVTYMSGMEKNLEVLTRALG